MEYLNLFFNDFMGHQEPVPLAFYVGLIQLSDSIKNIFICGLVQHGGE